jgi:hypothetical protein
MLIYFHIDELARDSVVGSALKREFAACGGRVVYGNRFTSDYILKHLCPFDVIILPSLLHFYGAFPNAAALPSNVFILQSEAIGQATGTLKRLNGKYFGDDPSKYAPWHKAVRGYLLWGPAHLNAFQEYYPEYLPKCRVVGHPRLSARCKGKPVQRTDTRPVIGFVSRFTLLSPFDARTPFESVASSWRFGKNTKPIYEGSPDKDVEDLFYTEAIDFRIMLQIIMTLDPANYRISVRPHPRENRMGWQHLAHKLGLNITVSKWDVPFSQWLQEVDRIVTPPSTGLYDMFFHGHRPIVIDKIVPSRSDHILAQSDDRNQILNGICRPESVNEVLHIIESGNIPSPPENVGLCLREQVGAEIADQSTSNIVASIRELYSNREVPPRRFGVVHAWLFLTALLMEVKEIKARLQGRVEQSASFNLTIRRGRWIDALSQ